MASTIDPTALPEPLSSVLEAWGSTPTNTPLPRCGDCDSGSDSDSRDVIMESDGSGVDQFSLLCDKRVKRKRKLPCSALPV